MTPEPTIGTSRAKVLKLRVPHSPDHRAQPQPDAPRARSEAHAWTAIALAIFTLALSTPFGDVFRAGISDNVPFYARNPDAAAMEQPPQPDGMPQLESSKETWRWVLEHDLHLVAWLVSRNARVLGSAPLDLYETGLCHPASDTLARGEPMLTLGLLGVPAAWLSGDPMITYNFALLFMTLLSAFAMYIVVADWSGSRPAGIAAGLIYAFQAAKLYNIVHPYIDDTVYTLLALYFARRMFETGRPLDGLATGSFCALQIGGSFYPFLGAVVLAGPVALWLVTAYGVRRPRPLTWALAGLPILVAVLLVFAPAIGSIAGEARQSGGFRSFLAPSWFVPEGRYYHEWYFYLLALLGFLLPRRLVLKGLGSDPRWALATGALLAVGLAWQGKSGLHPNAVYGWLESFVPGLAQVRAPGHLATVAHLVASMACGFGCAGLLALVSERRRTLAGALAIALCFVAFLRPAWLGLTPAVRFEAMRMRPSSEALAFFDGLAAQGNEGAIAEVPVQALEHGQRIVVMGYHGRPTSVCSGSIHPPESLEVDALLRKLPGAAAVVRLRELGFTTVVVHHAEGARWFWVRTQRKEYERAVEAGVLRELAADRDRTAFELLPGEAP